jgi:F-type H+-transporting ATPase subunit epsilon
MPALPHRQPRPRPLQLKILLPDRVFADETEITRIVFVTPGGSFGLLPHRADCVAAIVPGLFVYQADDADEVIVALDEGVLIKAGGNVLVSVRRAMAGPDIGQLQHSIAAEFLTLSDLQQAQRHVSAQIESSFVKRLAAFEDA